MSRLDDLATALAGLGWSIDRPEKTIIRLTRIPDLRSHTICLTVWSNGDTYFGQYRGDHVSDNPITITPEIAETFARIRAWQAPDQRPDAVTISDAMVERAAEKMWEIGTGETWLRIGWGGPAKPPYINDARAVLEAALVPETPDGQ